MGLVFPMAFTPPGYFRLSINGFLASPEGEKPLREEYFVRVNTTGDELDFPGLRIRIRNSDRHDGALTALLEAAALTELTDLTATAVQPITIEEMPEGDGKAGSLDGNHIWLGDRFPVPLG